MKKIAITGGIGSGKSTVLEILKNQGYHVLSSDEIVNDLYKKRKIRKRLKALFPSAVKGIWLKLDRTAIAKEVFSNPEKHKALTNLITPLVIEEINNRAKKLNATCFVEVPLLFECGYQDLFDESWVVVRDRQARVKSVMARSNLTEEQVIARISNQVDYDSLDLTGFVIIENNGDKQALQNQILEKIKNL